MLFSRLTPALKTHAIRIYSWLTSVPSTPGPSIPPDDSGTSASCAPQPETLSSMAVALSPISGAVQASEVIYRAGADLIHVAEQAYAESDASGSTKKMAVLKALEAFALSIGENWDAIRAEISAWIDMVVQSWNKLKELAPAPVAATVTA